MKNTSNFMKFSRFFRLMCFMILSVILVHIISMLTLDKMIEYNKISFYSENFPREISGYKIAFISAIYCDS